MMDQTCNLTIEHWVAVLETVLEPNDAKVFLISRWIDDKRIIIYTKECRKLLYLHSQLRNICEDK